MLGLIVAPAVAAVALAVRNHPLGSLLAAPPIVATAAAWGEPGLGLIVGVALLPLWEQKGASGTRAAAVLAAAAGGGAAPILASTGALGGFLQEGFLAAALAALVGVVVLLAEPRLVRRSPWSWGAVALLAPVLVAGVGVGLLTTVPEAMRATGGWITGALLASGLGALVVRRGHPVADLRVALLLSLLVASEVLELGASLAIPLGVVTAAAAASLVAPERVARFAPAWRWVVAGLALVAAVESPWIPWESGGSFQFPGFGRGGRELGTAATWGIRPLFAVAGGLAAAFDRPFALGTVAVLPLAAALLAWG